MRPNGRIHIPGSLVPRTPKTCELCSNPSTFTVILKIKVMNPDTKKTIVSDMEMSVCDEHADKLEVQVDKFVRVEKKPKLII